MSEPISGTQLDHWRRCNRLYHYAHDRKIMPRELPWPLAVGRAGHEILAYYYQARQAGSPHEEAQQESRSWTSYGIDVLGHDPKVTGFALAVAGYYWATIGADPGWVYVAVEQEVRNERAGWTFVMTADLLAAPAAGGDLEVWDHRFLYDPYPAAMVRADPQLPRYAAAVGPAMGTTVTRVVRNMISTAPIAALAKANRGRVRRVGVDLTPERMLTVQVETDRTAAEIVAWRGLDPAIRSQLAVRTFIPGERYPSCSTCSFFKLCTAEAWGEAGAAELQAKEYVPSDYGYQE